MSPPVHLLLDYENIQPSAEELAQVRGAHYRLWILHGPHQKHFTCERVCAWQPLGEQVRFVQSVKPGKNALDLHVAYCMGEAVERSRAASQTGRYIVISQDKGFEALFGYLQNQGLRVDRAESLPHALSLAGNLSKEMPGHAAALAVPTLPEVERVIELLRQRPQQNPRNEKRLHNYVASFLAKDPSNKEVVRIVKALKSRGIVVLEGTRTRYDGPPRKTAIKAAA